MLQGDSGIIGPVGLTGQEGRKVRPEQRTVGPRKASEDPCNVLKCSHLPFDVVSEHSALNCEALEKFGKAQKRKLA